MDIAIFDSERIRADGVFRSLLAAGYVCRVYRSRERLFDTPEDQVPAILLLGTGKMTRDLPAMVLQMKERGVKKILLMAKTDEVKSVNEGLAAGVDDYLCLPLRQHELQMRVSVLARQIILDAQLHRHLIHGDFEFGRYPNHLKYKGENLKLSAKEFDLALLFFRHVGKPLSRVHIAEAIWKQDGNDMERTIDTHVSRVRNKLNLRPENGFLLKQVYGFGYQLLCLPEK